MFRKKINFEVQILRDGRWVMQEICDDEAAATELAQKFLKRSEIEGARVVRDWQRNDDRHVEKVVFCEEKRRNEKEKIIANQIDSANQCTVYEDYFRLESRLTINRVIRTYLDRQVLTPTELLHNFSELRRLSNFDSLLPASVDRVASLQARQSGEDSRARRDAIFGTFEKIMAEAREAERSRALQSLSGKDFAGTYAKVASVVDVPERRDYLALVALSRHLVTNRNWLGKLADLVEQVKPEVAPDATRLVDGVIADVLGSPVVVQELLGWQPNLATAVCRLADLCEGKMPAADRPEDDILHVLNRLFAKNALPSARTALVDRIRRQLAGAGALNRMEPAKEAGAFKQVLDRLLHVDGTFGGPPTAEALTRRAFRMGERGGAKGESEAIVTTLRQIGDRERTVVYLVDLAGTPFGVEHMTDIVGHLQAMAAADSVDGIVGSHLPPRDKMATVTRMFDRLKDSEIPEEPREALCGKLDELLAAYLLKEGIIEKLDTPTDSLRIRAIRLVQFCGSGILTRGKALAMARDRVIKHLRHPNFDQTFVEDLPTQEEKEKAARDFFLLLRNAGFQ